MTITPIPGRTYVDRVGGLHTMRPRDSTMYPFADEYGRPYDASGRHIVQTLSPNDLDLIALAPPQPDADPADPIHTYDTDVTPEAVDIIRKRAAKLTLVSLTLPIDAAVTAFFALDREAQEKLVREWMA